MAAPIGSMSSQPIERKPSPWLHWGIAIAIGFMGIGGAIGASIGLLFGANNWMDEMPPEPEHPEEYPINGTSENQSAWNKTNQEYEEWELGVGFIEAFSDSNFYEDQANIAMFLGLTSIPVVTLLMARHERAFDSAMIWIALKTFGEIYIVFSFSLVFQGILDLFPELGGLKIVWIYRFIGWSQIACCNIILLAIILVCATKARTGVDEIPSSAFHLDIKHNQDEQ